MRTANSIVGGGLLACLAAAKPMPQQLDFNQIAAAPAVPLGPADNGGSNQTATLYTNVVVTAQASAAATPAAKRNMRRSGNQVITTYNAQYGQQSVLSGVDRGALTWLSGGSTHLLYGNINNYGSLVVSQTSYLKQNPNAGGMTSNWVGHDANNGNLQNYPGALIQLNDIGSKSAPTYDWYIRSMINNGTVQWCGRGDTGGSTFQLYNDIDSVNNGLISFEQTLDNKGASFVWRNPTLTTGSSGANLYNNGAFRLINVNFHNVQNIYGSGCWQIGKGAIFYLEDGTGVFQNPTKGSSLPGQSITFQDPSAVLHMDTAVYSKNSNFGAKIYGFGSGNAIEFYETIKSFSYSASGTLSVTMVSGNVCNMNIGTGYDASKFVNKRNPQKYNTGGYNAIFYLGSCPSQSVPSSCSIDAPACSDLGSNPPNPPTSSSSVAPTTTAVPTTSAIPTTSSAAPTTTAAVSSSSSSSPAVTTPSPISTSTAQPTSSSFVISTAASSSSTNTAYTPYYPALSTTTTGTDNGGTPTTASTSACPTTPEDGTYCGFINPEDPCAPQPDGYGPVPTPDTPSAFLAYPPFHSMASAAPTVVPSVNNTQYTQTFRDLNASSSAQSYLGLLTLKSYDVAYCANACDNTNLCTAFNIYIERDPSLNPTNNDSTAPTIWGYNCPNPASMTTYKCTLWGSNLDASTATNQGEYREQFQVVITGSNGYDKTNVTTPADPTGPITDPVPSATSTPDAGPSSSATFISTTAAPVTTSSGAGAITTTVGATSSTVAAGVTTVSTATPLKPTPTSTGCTKPWNKPKNCHGKAINNPKGWLGSRFFPGPYNPQVCSDFALKQNAYNKQAAIAAGKHSYSACQMFNAYYLHKNGRPHGTYCSLYTQDLDPGSFATYGGGFSGGDSYECKTSWTWSLTIPDAGTC